jgi:hypothetical protein
MAPEIRPTLVDGHGRDGVAHVDGGAVTDAFETGRDVSAVADSTDHGRPPVTRMPDTPALIAPVLMTEPVSVLSLMVIPTARAVVLVVITPGLVLATLPVPPLTVEF